MSSIELSFLCKPYIPYSFFNIDIYLSDIDFYKSIIFMPNGIFNGIFNGFVHLMIYLRLGLEKERERETERKRERERERKSKRQRDR